MGTVRRGQGADSTRVRGLSGFLGEAGDTWVSLEGLASF